MSDAVNIPPDSFAQGGRVPSDIGVGTISLIITTRNRQTLLDRAISSALSDPLLFSEIVVVDDASWPVATVVDGPSVRPVRFPERRGVTAARNEGLRIATSRYITFLDDDDEIIPDGVRVALQALTETTSLDPVVALTAIEVVSDQGTVREVRKPISVQRGASFFAADTGSTFQDGNSLISPVELLRHIGGWNETFLGWEVEDLLLRLGKEASLLGVDTPGYRLYLHDGPALHRDRRVMIEGARQTLSLHRDSFRDTPERAVRYHVILALLYLEEGERWNAVRSGLAAVRLKPLQLRLWLHLFGILVTPRRYTRLRRVRNLNH
jgi:glycosyltransferase involved in cell wall biosynthesis